MGLTYIFSFIVFKTHVKDQNQPVSDFLILTETFSHKSDGFY